MRCRTKSIHGLRRIKRCLRLAPVLAAGILLLVAPSAADIYRYVDDDGVIHYTDDIDRVPAKYKDIMEQQKTMRREGSSQPPEPQPQNRVKGPTVFPVRKKAPADQPPEPDAAAEEGAAPETPESPDAVEEGAETETPESPDAVEEGAEIETPESPDAVEEGVETETPESPGETEEEKASRESAAIKRPSEIGSFAVASTMRSPSLEIG